MGVPLPALVDRCLREHRERKIRALVDALESIADSGPDNEPKPQKGSDHDVLLAYEDGYADASYERAETARDALLDWEDA